jgi:hypothetical protein
MRFSGLMNNRPQENKLGRLLFRLSLLTAAILIVIVSLIQLWISYQAKIHSVLDTFTYICNAEVRGISTALWNYSLPELEALTESITNHPLVANVDIC